MEKEKVAWVVTNDFEGESLIIFHHHALAARRIGAAELNIDFEDAEVKRAKEFDQYASLGYVPDKNLLENGWWVHCHDCHSQISLDDEDVNEEDIVFEGRLTYCGKDCQESHKKNVSKYNEQFEAFKSKVLKTRPDLIFTFSGGYPITFPHAKFTFKGCQYGGSVHVKPDNTLLWNVCKGDLNDWHQYEKARMETSNCE